MNRETNIRIGALHVRQFFDQSSGSWLTTVVDANGTQLGDVEYCAYGDAASRRQQLTMCKKRARELQNISGARGINPI